MKFIAVDVLPARGNNTARNSELHQFFTDFLGSDIKIARAEWREDEYQSYMSCYTSLHKTATYNDLPIKVIARNGNIYLVKI